MLEKFGDYMYYLLSAPFKQVRKEKNQWYIYFKVIGQLFDKNKRMFRRVREESMVQTASTVMLPEHGLDRGLSRYEGESWENYRIRLMMYADTCLLGGTEAGTLIAAQSLGFIEAQMIPCYELDGNRNRWAEFFVILPMDTNTIYPISIDQLRKEIRRTKEVGAKDHYRVRIQGETMLQECTALNRIVFRMKIRWYNNIIWDGSETWNGKHQWDSYRGNHPMRTIIRLKAPSDIRQEAGVVQKYHYRTWNGDSRWDGTKKWDAEIIEEVL